MERVTLDWNKSRSEKDALLIDRAQQQRMIRKRRFIEDKVYFHLWEKVQAKEEGKGSKIMTKNAGRRKTGLIFMCQVVT